MLMGSESCFTEKNGTPRQPQICAGARAKLAIQTGVENPHHALGFPTILQLTVLSDGLDEYSYILLIFVFHYNANVSVKVGLHRCENYSNRTKSPLLASMAKREAFLRRDRRIGQIPLVCL